MINTLKILITIAAITLSMHANSNELPVNKNLEVFIPYLGTWEANFAVAQGKPAVMDVSKWERALNGQAIRTLHSINQGVYGGESLIFFDKEKQQVVFYYFTTAGFYTQGYFEFTNSNTFIAYEDVSGNKDGITKVRSTSELLNDKMKVSTAYLKNGKWTEPEQRTYTRSDKSVEFK